ncbi:hypothetical protein dqs_0606 [Azoarcus olearius]|uniref:phage tail fiber protein n=1 Tax=Azoarcus sp. (strain BH72) TaxID=418699 RepID=UPI00080633AE|nr:hypothetical protein [Azoarcus olearius]ANQ83682.1 hypothetical protein dqs_0606 [Azoarcus olearius]
MKRSLRSIAVAAFLVAGLAIAAPASAGSLTDHGENKTLDALLRGQTLGAPATWYVGVTTDTCTDAGNGTEPSGGAYARVAVAASLANWAGTQGVGTTTASSGTSGTTSNNALISMPETTAAWSTIRAVRFYDASTAGNAWICLPITLPLDVDRAGVTVKFPAATLQFSIDD